MFCVCLLITDCFFVAYIICVLIDIFFLVLTSLCDLLCYLDYLSFRFIHCLHVPSFCVVCCWIAVSCLLLCLAFSFSFFPRLLSRC